MVNEVTESNTRANFFKYIYTLIDNNKVTGTTVLAGFSSDNVTFPCYVINPALVSISGATKGKDIQAYTLKIEIELWCKAVDLKAKIDAMKDNIQNTILTNKTALEAQNLCIAKDWFDDSNVDTLEFDMVKYHTGGVILSFDLI